MSSDVWEQVYERLGRAGRRASHHAGVRQHPPHGRARRAPSLRAPRQGGRHRAPRQPGEGAAARRRAAAEARRAQGAGRHRLAGAWASTSATSIWSASSARRARSPHSCSGSAAPATRSAARRKARLFPLSRDDLVECAALLDGVRRGELDRAARCRTEPLDVLAQQIVAEVAAAGLATRRAVRAACAARWPFRVLAREEFDAVVRMLAEGFTTRRGRARRAHASRRRQPPAARPARRAH